MNIYKHMKMAEEMELPKSFAIRSRQRYLTEKKRELDTSIIVLNTWLDGDYDANYEYACLLTIKDLTLRGGVVKELKAIKQMGRRKESEITDDMIENAENYPVDRLIEFRFGKAKAFCHEDKHPSMFHATRNNTANCPVCDKVFNSINILMQRDGMDFKSAVKQLN